MPPSTTLNVRIARVETAGDDLPLPAYATSGSAGMDICAAIDVSIGPRETALVPAGFKLELPEGYEAQIRPRSGLAAKHSIGILNSPGTIDSDYRGEVKIILTNFGSGEFTVHRGDRIAQMVVAPVTRVVWDVVDAVDETVRGAGGFGHSGR